MLPNEYLIPPFANEAAFLMEQLMDARVVPRDSVPRRDPPSPCLTVCGQPCASPCRTERKIALQVRPPPIKRRSRELADPPAGSLRFLQQSWACRHARIAKASVTTNPSTMSAIAKLLNEPVLPEHLFSLTVSSSVSDQHAEQGTPERTDQANPDDDDCTTTHKHE